MDGKQCPRCRRHRHEEVMITKDKKKWLIDRCFEETCHYNFEIEEWNGPNSKTNEQKHWRNYWLSDGK